MDNPPLSTPQAKKITAAYFSPTGTSKRIARAIAGAMAAALNMETADFPSPFPPTAKSPFRISAGAARSSSRFLCTPEESPPLRSR